ncbi:MAG: Tol-Pal system beta propeller repeat protein TolB [Candidatus Hydrogenedentota bacterium]|nr:MAG: Tol-Pal system beta propeller repeat protein TolB [Candidatus Hydrogenedentota bacterium]
MIRRLSLAILLIAILFFCTNRLAGQHDIIIDIYEPGTAKIKIGIPPFVRDPSSPPLAQTGIGEEIAGVIREDLEFTGLFRVFGSLPGNIEEYETASPFAPLKAWTALDVQSVVQGKYKQNSDKIALECILLDAESGTRIVGRLYSGYPREVRAIAHRFADEIVNRYTGKRGIGHTSIAYVRERGDRKEIHIMDYDGHNSYQLTNDNSIALSPDWSSDGGKLVFTSYKDHNPDVYMVDLEKRSYVRISGYIGLNTAPAFSPDGETLALTLSKDGNPEIYLLTLKTGKLTRLTRSSRIDTSPAWSPNGREIAFVSDRSGSPQIYIVDREGVNLRRLTYSHSYNTSPAWSPLGDKIAYVSMVEGKGEIYTIIPTGSGMHRLTFNGGNEDPCWSPDGRYLAYSSNRGGHKDIYIMRADGSGRKRVTLGGGDNMSPAWSP